MTTLHDFDLPECGDDPCDLERVPWESPEGAAFLHNLAAMADRLGDDELARSYKHRAETIATMGRLVFFSDATQWDGARVLMEVNRLNAHVPMFEEDGKRYVVPRPRVAEVKKLGSWAIVHLLSHLSYAAHLLGLHRYEIALQLHAREALFHAVAAEMGHDLPARYDA